MEESAPKRRRTSPRLSNQPSSEDAPAQPTPQSSPRRARPSYASPTRASLSRGYPQILERQRSLSPLKQLSPSRIPVPQPRNSADPTRSSQGSTSAATIRRPVDALAASEAAGPPENETAEEIAEPAELRWPRARGGLSAAPRRSLPRPSPRPLPAPPPDGEDDNPFLGRTLRRSPETGVSIPPPLEPELPPSIDDPVSSTPPKGIHSSSPSGRKFRSRPATSSPLKQPPVRPDDNDGENSFLSRNPKKPKFPRPRLARPRVLEERSPNVRNVPAFDALDDKKKERDGLREELGKLKRDLEHAQRENQRIRTMQASGRTVVFTDEDATLNLIKRYLGREEDASQPVQSQLLARAALDPLAILPFAGRPNPILLTQDDNDDTVEVKSHHPIPMSAKEELPFLQLFSPFSATAQLSTAPRTGDEVVSQQYNVNLTSRHEPGLFYARIEILTDPVDLRILSLKVPTLDPAARPELEPFLRKVCAGECNRSMQQNCGIATWAMAEWLRVAEHRARFWYQLQRELGSKEALQATTRNIRTRKQKRMRDEHEKESADGNQPVKKADMYALIGQQTLDIQIPTAARGDVSASVRLSWTIDFDWTAEAQSKVSATVNLPGKWHHADQKQAMGKLPSLFRSLVENGESPNMAARKVVALLVGDE